MELKGERMPIEGRRAAGGRITMMAFPDLIKGTKGIREVGSASDPYLPKVHKGG